MRAELESCFASSHGTTARLTSQPPSPPHAPDKRAFLSTGALALASCVFNGSHMFDGRVHAGEITTLLPFPPAHGGRIM